jgi:hypothetical protein
MKRTFTHQPVVPPGWTGDKNQFNNWQKDLQKKLDKIMGTKIAHKYAV